MLADSQHASISEGVARGQHAGAFSGRRGQGRGRRAADWGLSKTSPQTQTDDLKTQGRGVAGDLVAVIAGACEPPERQRRTARRCLV